MEHGRVFAQPAQMSVFRRLLGVLWGLYSCSGIVLYWILLATEKYYKNEVTEFTNQLIDFLIKLPWKSCHFKLETMYSGNLIN